MKFYENPSGRSRAFPYTHTDGRKYVGMTWIIVAFVTLLQMSPKFLHLFHAIYLCVLYDFLKRV